MKKFIAFFTVLLVMFACSKDKNGTNMTFDEVVSNGGDFTPAVQSENTLSSTESNEVIDGDVWNCTTTTYDAM
ncbi:MAG TPA: hypothetical protein VE870_17415, partial [Bacteroidales bacterium]|nr:hypothetical protein [Bacteroidales bacterium]